jgi:hypothetical protein
VAAAPTQLCTQSLFLRISVCNHQSIPAPLRQSLAPLCGCATVQEAAAHNRYVHSCSSGCVLAGGTSRLTFAPSVDRPPMWSPACVAARLAAGGLVASVTNGTLISPHTRI